MNTKECLEKKGKQRHYCIKDKLVTFCKNECYTNTNINNHLQTNCMKDCLKNLNDHYSENFDKYINKTENIE